MPSPTVTKRWAPMFRHEGGCRLRMFSKQLFYKWNYQGNDKAIEDFFSMYQMGGEL
jgi:hypothetical protein